MIAQRDSGKVVDKYYCMNYSEKEIAEDKSESLKRIYCR
jgi:hypothetical protein